MATMWMISTFSYWAAWATRASRMMDGSPQAWATTTRWPDLICCTACAGVKRCSLYQVLQVIRMTSFSFCLSCSVVCAVGVVALLYKQFPCQTKRKTKKFAEFPRKKLVCPVAFPEIAWKTGKSKQRTVSFSKKRGTLGGSFGQSIDAKLKRVAKLKRELESTGDGKKHPF